MTNFKFPKKSGVGNGVVSKILSFGLILLLSVVTSASLNSLHAQSSSFSKPNQSKELSDLGVKQVLIALQNEIDFLRQDMRSGPPNVNGAKSISLGSVFHTGLISAYTSVQMGVDSRADLQEQMLNKVLQGPLFIDSDDGGTSSIVDMTPAKKRQLNDIIAFVQSWDVSENNVGDLVDALEQIRELKN